MFETHLTVVGKLITGVEQRRFADGSVVANFRIVSTERRYDPDAKTWADGDKLFLDVGCRRRLAENTFASLVKGDVVVVTGRLHTREFEHEGRRRSTMTLEARSVGADLSWCTAVLARTDRRDSTSAPADGAGDDHREESGSGRPTSPSVDLTPSAAGGASRLVGAAPGGES
jgi:single-strand DNA-binding protein